MSLFLKDCFLFCAFPFFRSISSWHLWRSRGRAYRTRTFLKRLEKSQKQSRSFHLTKFPSKTNFQFLGISTKLSKNQKKTIFIILFLPKNTFYIWKMTNAQEMKGTRQRVLQERPEQRGHRGLQQSHPTLQRSERWEDPGSLPQEQSRHLSEGGELRRDNRRLYKVCLPGNKYLIHILKYHIIIFQQ